jgi:outer membrane protein OmpA-like peptidoglycan-associated protein
MLRSYWWVLAVALLAIVLKALLLTPWVAGKAEDAAVTALAAEGLGDVGWVGVDGVDGLGGDGLNVILEGPAGDEAAAVAAVEAREEVDQVIYRPLAAADSGDSTDDTDSAGNEEPDDTANDEAAAGADLVPAEVGIEVGSDSVVLTGLVASAVARDSIVEAATARFGLAVDDRLVVDDSVDAASGSIVVSGTAGSDAVQAGWLESGQAVADAAGFDLVDQTEVAAVEEQLNDLFELEPIEFDVSRSTIRDESIATLDRAAEILVANPSAGRLRVVGHTDSDGSAPANLRLSNARAAAVVEYLVESGGVDPDRLEAEGRGESELLVDPDLTAEDKQRNRRIEWERIS